jgi:hypothetical protein
MTLASLGAAQARASAVQAASSQASVEAQVLVMIFLRHIGAGRVACFLPGKIQARTTSCPCRVGTKRLLLFGIVATFRF